MIAVFAHAFSNEFERNYWLSEPMLGLTTEFLDRAAGLKDIATLYVLRESGASPLPTHSPKIRHLELAAGPEVCAVPRSAALFDWLAVASLLDEVSQAPAEDVLCLGLPAVWLAGQALRKAVAFYFRKGRAPVVSVSSTRDHPCQCSFHYTVRDTCLIHFFEEERHSAALGVDAEEFLLTRPYAAVRDWPAGSSVQTPAFAEGVRTVADGQGGLRLVLAKRHFPELARAPRQCGVFHRRLWSDAPLGEVRAAPGCVVIHFPPSCSGGELRFLFQPFSARGRGGQWPVGHAVLAGGRVQAAMNPAKADGLVCTILEASGEGTYDLSLPVEVGQGIIGHQKGSMAPVNLITGQPIHGRQDYPELFLWDKTLSLAPRALAGQLEAHIASGASYGFPVESAGGGPLESEIHALLAGYDALQRRDCPVPRIGVLTPHHGRRA